ncbi:MAG: cobalamin-dependent protein [Desulfobacteraceae bacterium]|nr:cobalamin-dependent protein [Desulfobacteraceae bacterium]
MNSPLNQNTVDKRLDQLLEKITELKEEESIAELQHLLHQGVDPRELLACCMGGMRRIGNLFEEGRYFISALIMAGEIMRSATELLSPHLTPEPVSGGGGRVLLGTIKGDIHDLGKNLFALLLQSHGFEIIDLGVDVSAEIFFENAKQQQPDIIAISCVLTSGIDNLQQAINHLKENLPHPRPGVIVGGACLDQRVADYVGTRQWAKDAAIGLKICQQIMREAEGNQA